MTPRGDLMKRRRRPTKTKIRKPRPHQNQKPARPRTAGEFFAMSAKSQDRWTRVTHVISKMRADGVSLRQASQEFGLDPRTVARLGRSALRKGSDGRYKAKASDRLLRVLVIPTRKGQREIAVRDSREATLISDHANAVKKYLETGDDSALRKLRRKSVIDANGKRVRLLTNLSELDRLGSAGVLSFESLYVKAG
jgi:hypothetical protein